MIEGSASKEYLVFQRDFSCFQNPLKCFKVSVNFVGYLTAPGKFQRPLKEVFVSLRGSVSQP